MCRNKYFKAYVNYQNVTPAYNYLMYIIIQYLYKGNVDVVNFTFGFIHSCT